MRQQFQQPRGRKNKEVYDLESGGTFPSFYRPESEGSDSDQGDTSSIDDVLAQNAALMSGLPLSGGDLSNKEAGVPGVGASQTQSDLAEGNKVSSLYNPGGESKSFISKALGSKKKKILTGGIGGGLVGILITVMFVLPLKIINTVENLQNTFGSAAEQATSEMGQRLLRAYIVNRVIPGMMGDRRCTSTRVNTSCVKTSLSDTPVSALFNAWKDNNIEKKLADRGIVLEREGSNFRMITPATLSTNGIDLGRVDLNDLDSTDRSLRQVMSRQEVRREMKKAFEDETRSKRIMYRYKYGAYMERKHGIKRCLIKCDTRDDFNDKLDAKKAAWKTFYIQRVISPRTEINGLVLQCAINGFDCTKDSDDVDDDGTRQTQLEKDVLEAVKKFHADGGDLDELHKKTEDFRNGGYAKLLLGDLTEKATAKFAAKAIPYVGWIDLAYQIFGAVQVAGPAALKINYIINSQAAIQTYSMYRTGADEIKAGAVDAEVLGSITNSLGPAAGTDQGGKGAEASFYYQQINGSSADTTALLSGGRVYAANAVGCDDGETYPSFDEPLCEEERLDTVRGISKVAGGVSTIADSPAFLLTQVNGAIWNNSVGKLLELLEKAAGAGIGAAVDLAKKAVPGVDWLFDQTAEFISQMSQWFVNSFTNNPFTDSMSGARNYNIAAVGANAAMNDFTHYMLGGKQVSDVAMNEIRNSVEEERYQEFASQSLASRLTDTSSRYSAISKAAASVPGTSLTTSAQSLSTSLLNPTKAISNSLLSFSTRKSKAATNRTIDSAGVTQYAWDLTDKVFTNDPETYWQENDCDNPDIVKEWGKDTVENPITGMPEHNKPLGCKLLDNAISMNGAYYSDEFLTSEELGNSEDGDATNTGTGATLIAATYNLPSKEKGGFDEDDWAKAVKLIKDKKMDVIGFQEISSRDGGNNYGYLTNNLPRYGVYPDWVIKANYCANSQPIFYNKDKFDFVKAELLVYPRYDNNETNCGKGGRINKGESQAPIIWLTTKDDPKSGTKAGQTIIFMNTHNAADGFGDIGEDGGRRRFEAAKIYTKKIEDLRAANPGVPIVFTGDFNEGYGVRDDKNNTYMNKQENLFFCMITGKNLMKITEAPDKDCNQRNTRGDVDYIYVTSEIKVNQNWVIRGRQTSGSDHGRTPIYASITIPGNAALSSSCYNVPITHGRTVEGRILHKYDPPSFNDKNVKSYAFENSPQGIAYAAKNGYDSVDVDIQVTKDGVPVASHWGTPLKNNGDDTFKDPLGKISTNTSISAMTFDQVSRLRSGAGLRIYSIEEIVKLLAENKLNLSLELKKASDAKSIPAITGWLNQHQVQAIVKADANQNALQSALGVARDYGYWTRGTLGSEGWKKPTPKCEEKNQESGSDAFVWPISKSDYVPLSNCYRRPNPNQTGHTGIDIPVKNKRVLAAANGEVVQVGGPGGDGGNYIVIKHANGKWTNYQHLSVKSVKKGDRVSAGSAIGISGNTGFSTGGHLHFSITTEPGLDSRSSVAYSLNPLTFLPKDRNLGGCN